MTNCRLLPLIRRAWAWFLARPRIDVLRVTDAGYIISEPSGERYRINVYPRGEKVHMAVDSTKHLWLQRAVRQEGFDHLAVESDPEDAEAAREALVKQADRHVAAAKRAWDLGWRPAVD